jgi:hypothetical protein
MLIDCDECAMRNVACEDCVVSVLLGPPDATSDQPSVDHGIGPPEIAWARNGIQRNGIQRNGVQRSGVALDPAERTAVANLIEAGLISSLHVAYVTHNHGKRVPSSSDEATQRRHAVG